MRISEGPTAGCQLRPYSRHVFISRQFIGDAHDEFTDVGVGGGQPAFILQLGGDRSDFFGSEAASKQRK
jgi:16S rRNA G527 N7-methylase RsmG